MSKAFYAGFAVGLLIVLIAVVISYKKFGRDLKGDPDERQLLIRGNAYKYAFFTTMIAIMALTFLHSETDLLPITEGVGAVWSCMLGLAVFVCYCIMKDAYFGLKDKKSTFLTIMILVTVGNGLPVVMDIIDGNLMENGVLGLRGFNIGAAVLFLAVIICMLIKQVVDKAEEEE